MSDNTAGSTSLRRVLADAIAYSKRRDTYELQSTLGDRENVAVTADAIDALREAHAGCGKRCGLGCRCGAKWYDTTVVLCDDCGLKRDAAISRLLGSEIEGDTNGR